MTVAELAKKLAAVDPGLEVLCYTEDENLVPANHLFRLFHIEDVSTVEAEKTRGAAE